jgi:hypothetical protein
MGFWAELRRRNVVRVAAAYLVVAWLVTQVVNVAAPALELPDWFDGAVFVLLAIGFAVSVVMSWVFELSAEGLKRTAQLTLGGPPAPPLARTDMALIGAIAVLVGVSLFQLARPDAAPTPAAPLAAASDLSIAEPLQLSHLDYGRIYYPTLWARELAGVRWQPVFKEIVTELDFVDYWRASGDWGDFCRPLGAEDFECE